METNLVAFDTETHLIQPGLLAPPLVCGSFAASDDVPNAFLFTADHAARTMSWELWADRTIVGANIAYDMAVLMAYDPGLLANIFAKYARGEVYDVQIAQALDAIANGHLFYDPATGVQIKDPHTGKTGRYSLATCVKLELGRENAKESAFWQKRYAYLEKLPLDQWPEEARKYPIDDAVNTLEVAKRQLARGTKNLHAMPREARAALSLHLGAVWGLRTDGERVEQLASEVEAAHQGRLDRFKEVGFIREDGSEDQRAVKRAVLRAYGATGPCQRCDGTGGVPNKQGIARIKENTARALDNKAREARGEKPRRLLKVPTVTCKASEGGCDGTGIDPETCTVPRTDKDGVSTSRDTLLESGDDLLEAYADDVSEKIRSTYIPFLRQGIKHPLNLRPNVLVSSFRTSYDGPIQQIPRSGGVRECFKARDGYVFCSCDYSSIELCTLAQAQIWVCGSSRMAEVINSGKDLHAAFGAAMAGLEYGEFVRRLKAGDKVCKGFRQAAKAANFGFPGGMGAPKLVLAKRKEGLRFCVTLEGATCGERMVTEWKRKPINPTCLRCLQLATKLRQDWFDQWPEMPKYFEKAAEVSDTTGARAIFGDIRGGMDFCTASNDWFQRMAAVGMKKALWAVTRECYLEELDSPLLGTRIPMAIHDELFMEMPAIAAHEAGPCAAAIMVREMREETEWGPAVTPDVLVKVEPALMHYWRKDAEPAYSQSGQLICWEDRETLPAEAR